MGWRKEEGRRGDADVVLADGVDSAAGAIGVGHAAKEGGSRGSGGGGDADVVLTRPACTAVGAQSELVLQPKVDDIVCVVADGAAEAIAANATRAKEVKEV